jgi:diguanylate cyclase (GGDEF)-like protein
MNKPQTVLVVDDRPDNVRVVAETLKGDCDVRFATTGARALELAGNGVDLILLDVVMPDLDGLEVCRRLKSDERTAGIPIIFVTSREETEDQTRGFDAGAVDYITKPIVPAIVRARVRTHLELKRSRDLLAEMALIDPLTGICNRRRFNDSLDGEWKRAARASRPLSLAMLDVDYFKRFNDTYGHARGDDCLRLVGRAVGDIARRVGDVAARYGGEEFALVLPDTDAEAMHGLMRSLLGNVAALGIEHSSSGVAPHVTVSVGAITMVPTVEGGAASAVEAADRLLYEAKAAGRAACMHIDLRTDTRVRIHA